MSQKIVFLSTVVRAAPLDKGGQVLKLDWESKNIIKRVTIYPSDPPIVDPNPRGGARGGRGIFILKDEVYVAAYHAIHVYDYDLNLLRIISNPQFVGLHEIETDGEYIWATSTAIDSLIQTDLEGNLVSYYNARSDKKLQEHFGLDPLDISYDNDNRLRYLDDLHLKDSSHVHLNAVALYGDKKYISMHSYGSIIELPSSKVVYENLSLKGYHNIRIIDDELILVNDTKNRMVKVIDLKTGELLKAIDVMKNPKLMIKHFFARVYMYLLKFGGVKKFHTRSFFYRGMTRISDSRILIGTSPAGLVEVDFKAGKVVDSFFFESDPNHCVHGLELMTEYK
ncbi:MAG: hypothetical protein JXQ87_09575 [Bacteroidia bacterium]